MLYWRKIIVFLELAAKIALLFGVLALFRVKNESSYQPQYTSPPLQLVHPSTLIPPGPDPIWHPAGTLLHFTWLCRNIISPGEREARTVVDRVAI